VNRAAGPVLAWAGLLSVLSVVLRIRTPEGLPPAIFGSAAALIWVVGLVVLLWPAGRPRVRALPDLSLPSVLVAVAIAMLVLGALVGEWLVLLGAGALVAGLVGVGRELRAERRLR
jgi:hypothetical protein